MHGTLTAAKKFLKGLLLRLPGGEAILRKIVEFRHPGYFQARAAEVSTPPPPAPPKDLKEIFTSHYRTNIWGSTESVSGVGSTLEYTNHLRQELPKLFAAYNVQTLLDAPCGDWNWFKVVERPSQMKYIGGDIVDELVQQNQLSYGDQNTTFVNMDITRDPLPAADLWICRDCLFHFSYEGIFKTLANFLESDIPYILTTIHTECKENQDIVPGQARQLNLELFPFDFPRAILYIKDWIPGHTIRSMGLWSKSMIAERLAANPEFQKWRNATQRTES